MSTNLNSARATIVGLYGDLGSGKTAFTQGVAESLGITDRVTSPTFVIEKIYEIQKLSSASTQAYPQAFKHLIHIDAYRIEHSDELVHLGWNDIVKDAGNLILVEWPERIADIMPPEHTRLKFTFIDETTREIEMIQ
jgi:tRNA threonylcarbamoyladenosine biosynthesis protein TsaE